MPTARQASMVPGISRQILQFIRHFIRAWTANHKTKEDFAKTAVKGALKLS